MAWNDNKDDYLFEMLIALAYWFIIVVFLVFISDLIANWGIDNL